MKTYRSIIFINVILIAIALIFSKCNNQDEGGSGQLNVKMTDAPSDDANIKGAFVTVSEVRVDGKAVDGFTRQTIDLTAYQRGSAKLLVSDNVNVGTYSDITIVLDHAKDDAGNEPGCYILTEDNKKHNLASSGEATSEIQLDKSFEVMSDAATDMVVDFDLRKAVKYDNSFDASSDYALVTETELKNALRIMVESNTGEIEGKVTQSAGTADRTIIYAYTKGTFDEDTELNGQGSGNIKFSNAITSSEVDMNDNYVLAYLEEGEYELHVATYNEDSSGKLAFAGMVEANSLTDGVLSNKVEVTAYTETTINLNLTGLIN